MNEKIIEQLHHPECYPGEAGEVQIFQTHLSVVCVAGDFAYKLKKPVKLPFLDFSTTKLREHFCHEEVRLNRRLCADLYLGVVPLRETEAGVTFRNDAGADGNIIDHAVHMGRLPQERMLDELLAGDGVSDEDVKAIARIVAQFHASADRGPEVREAGLPVHLERFALKNFAETRDLKGSVFDPMMHELLEAQTRKDFDRLRPVLEARANENRIVEGHGDLHARNICLSDPIAIYDCIEFSAGFRCADTATENAFLTMDLHYRGHPELAKLYLETYIAESGDSGQGPLIPTLVRYRAMVRAKVSAIVAGDSEINDRDREGALGSAQRHANLCAASVVAEKGPLMILACGLPGSGKSTVFEDLSRQTGWPCISSDRVRKELAGVTAEEKLPADFYGDTFSQRTYAEIAQRGAQGLDDSPVLLDANFGTSKLRQDTVEAARRAHAGARVVVVWFRLDDEVTEARMRAREIAAGGASDADLDIFRKLKQRFEIPQAEEEFELIVIDGNAAITKAIAQILCSLMKGEVN